MRQFIGYPDPHAAADLRRAANSAAGEEADFLLLQAAVLDAPLDPKLQEQMGHALRARGAAEEALLAFQKAVLLHDAAQPRHFMNLGNAYSLVSGIVEAEACFRQAALMDEALADAWVHLGVMRQKRQKPEEALACFDKAVAVNPACAVAYYSRAGLWLERREMDKALEDCNKALSLDPQLAEAWHRHGDVLMVMGRVRESTVSYQHALRIKPLLAPAHTALLFAAHYLSENTLSDLCDRAKAWGAQFAPASLAQSSHLNARDEHKRLKIGYVSADLCAHPVGYFMQNVFKHHRAAEVEVHVYANSNNSNRSDAITKALHKYTAHWHVIAGLSDVKVARLIARDGIDILVDLSGHTAGNRLGVFARKPAPVQMTWLGYFDTTGMQAMDYILCDRYVLPPEEEGYYTEAPLRLPDGYLCFTPPEEDVAVQALPGNAGEHITFGSFSNPSKLTEAAMECWADILRRVPGSTLFLRHMSYDRADVQHKIYAAFARCSIGAERLRMQGFAPRRELLECYNEVDVALDTFPYNGGTTLAEAMWMGVPVITLCGQGFMGKVGTSIVSAAGHSEWVAGDAAEYVSKAVSLASDREALRALRMHLREALLASPLCDAARFTRHLEAAYRSAWAQWCGAQVKTA